jgi:anthranilate/para-aminobenzoate synthase component I
VADSDPASEYAETVNKAKALLNAVEITQKRHDSQQSQRS